VNVRAIAAGWREARRRRRPWLDSPAPRAFIRSAIGAYRRRDEFRSVQSYCMFVGCPRSGSTLLASLLTAHPDAVVSNELDALRWVQLGFSRAQLYSLILERDAQFARAGRRWGGNRYVDSYVVPGSHQGRIRRLLLIGDKRGSDSCWWLAANPALLSKLAQRVRVPVRLIHPVRDPYDTIATMSRQSGHSLDNRIEWHHRHCQVTEELTRRQGAPPVMEVRNEDVIAATKATVSELCAFLGLECDDDYLESCAAMVRSSPHRSREKVDWSEDQLARVDRTIETFDFFAEHYPRWLPGGA
jgi:hypothetical protein